VLNAGCFAAGTKLWTPLGYRNVEDLQPGEWVYARAEHDPYGPIAAKVVEAKFARTGRILHLHLPGGRLIRTTPEHPFFLDGKGWTAAGALQAGDRLRTDGGWVAVAEVFDTGEYAPVYNLRVAEYHTYFVGDAGWGWALWAHNTYTVPQVVQTAVNQVLPGLGSTPAAVIDMGVNMRRGTWREQARKQGITVTDSIVYVIQDVGSGEMLKVGESGRGCDRFEPYLTQARSENRNIRIFIWKTPNATTRAARETTYEKPIKRSLRAAQQRLLWEADAYVFQLRLDATQPDVRLSLAQSSWRPEGRDQGLAAREPLVYIVRDLTTGEVLKAGETANWQDGFERYVTRANQEGRTVGVEIWRLTGRPHSGSDRTRYWEAPLAFYFVSRGAMLPWDQEELGRNPLAIVVPW
jgi:hypothetical protein